MGETDGEVGEGVRGFGDGWHVFIFGGGEGGFDIGKICQHRLLPRSFFFFSFVRFACLLLIIDDIPPGMNIRFLHIE